MSNCQYLSKIIPMWNLLFWILSCPHLWPSVLEEINFENFHGVSRSTKWTSVVYNANFINFSQVKNLGNIWIDVFNDWKTFFSNEILLKLSQFLNHLLWRTPKLLMDSTTSPKVNNGRRRSWGYAPWLTALRG
jgi:hypothetical protein